MSGTTVMIVAILSGIGLSAVYLVAEYSRWRKHVADKPKYRERMIPVAYAV